MPWSDKYEPTEEVNMDPVETKVKASTWFALLAAVLLAILNAVAADSAVLGPLPGWLQFVILAAAPPLAAFLGGYAAPHTTR